MRPFIRYIFYFSTFLLWCVFIFSGWNGHINPHSFWPASFVGVLFPWVYTLLVAFTFIHWLLKNKKTTLILTLSLMVGFFPFSRFYRVPHATFKDPNSLNIMTYNLFGQHNIKSRNKSVLGKNRSEFINFINKLGKFDVLLCQEFTFKNEDNYISNGLGMKHLVKFKKSGAAILTKYDVLDQGIIRFEKTSNAAVWADIKVKGKIIRFYSIHLQSNRVSGLVGDVTQDGEMTDSKTWSNVKKMISRVKKGGQMRTDQIQTILHHINNAPYPVIIGADLNETPWSYSYTQINQNFQDAFYVNGSGNGISYAGDLPGLKIDYIFVDTKFKILESFIAQSRFSDHLPQIAKLKID